MRICRTVRHAAIVAGIFFIAALAGCSGNASVDSGPRLGKSLVAYASCDALAAALAAAPVVERSWETEVSGGFEGGAFGEQPTAAGEADRTGQAAAASIEEADIAKEDGRYVYVLHHSGTLFIFDAADRATIAKVGQIDLGLWPVEMVVEGDVAAVIGYPSSGGAGGGGDMPVMSSSFTTVAAIVDLADRAAPTLVREVGLDGTYVDARLVGSVFHVVTSQWSGFAEGVTPAPADLMPMLSDVRLSGAVRDEAAVATECSSIYLPDPLRFDAQGGSYAVESTRVTSIDLSSAAGGVSSTVAVAAWPTVTASAQRLYLADWDAAYDESALHIFDIATDPLRASYVGAATFDGMVLDQFSIDEHAGQVRVAATTGRNTPGSDDNASRVLVFREQGSAIAEVGSVEGIAPGESIWSARFAGERAFLVTYLTVDPLISIDLSDPAHPQVAGQLEVPGVSTYLAEMDAQHLIAVGLDVAEGQTWGGGVTLSIFDVSDFAHPQLAHRVVVGDGDGGTYSEATTTHKAFAFFPEAGLVAVPVSRAPMVGMAEGGIGLSAQTIDAPASELYVFRVDAETGFTPAAVIDHAELLPSGTDPWAVYGLSMRRALLVADALFSISDYGIEAAPTEDLSATLFSAYLGI